MTCAEVIERGVAEKYAADELPPEEREAYEAHYFECPRCFEEVRRLCDVRDTLAADAARGYARRPWAPLAWYAAAAIVLIGVGIGLMRRDGTSREAPRPPQRAEEASREGSPPSERAARPSLPEAEAILARLAVVEPLPYERRQLRGSGRTSSREHGLALYAAGNYEGAVPLLEQACAAESDAEHACVYLGTALLLAGRVEESVQVLQGAASRGDSPYSEHAWFFLAKARLKQRRLDAAEEALERVLAAHGERAAEAKRLLADLRSLR